VTGAANLSYVSINWTFSSLSFEHSEHYELCFEFIEHALCQAFLIFYNIGTRMLTLKRQ